MSSTVIFFLFFVACNCLRCFGSGEMTGSGRRSKINQIGVCLIYVVGPLSTFGMGGSRTSFWEAFVGQFISVWRQRCTPAPPERNRLEGPVKGRERVKVLEQHHKPCVAQRASGIFSLPCPQTALGLRCGQLLRIRWIPFQNF